MKIWKFAITPVEPLSAADAQDIGYVECQAVVPAGAQFLKVGAQGGSIQSWWLCDPDWTEQQVESYAIVPTGGTVPKLTGIDAIYVDTVFMEGLVWHVFRLDPGF